MVMNGRARERALSVSNSVDGDRVGDLIGLWDFKTDAWLIQRSVVILWYACVRDLPRIANSTKARFLSSQPKTIFIAASDHLF